jgi:hypothetical protein
MAEWWRDGQGPESMMDERPAAEPEPPPLAQTERIAENMERLFLHEPEVTSELLTELARVAKCPSPDQDSSSVRA